jgi:ABC transport system ATP-binding/permease protein
MSLLLSCRSLDKSFGPRTLFRGLSISFDDTERTGVIGPNGSGKSTLLKILAGLEQPDAGTIEARRNLKRGYLPQQDTFPSGATIESVLLDAMRDDKLPGDEHDHQVEASILLGKVGFDRFDQPAESLSGGWRKRLAIARQLVRKPDVLLLDEPTNHLDLEGILWLEKLLAGAPFSFLLVSHDRYFLENTTNRIVDLNRAYADGYLSASGTYSDFLEQREGYLEAQQSRQQAVTSRVRREVEWLKRGAKARTTKAKGRIKEAGRLMDELADLKTRNTATGAAGIDLTASDRKTRKLLSATKVAKSLGGRMLFRDVEFVLSPGTKLGLLGPNGSGKTTLIRLLTGELQPDAGTITRADGLRVVWFDQNREHLEKSVPLRKALSLNGTDTIVYRGGAMHVTSWAKRFLFRTEQLDLPVSELSGGEQARVLVARLMLQPADVLILDEPTNDLDIPTLEVLEESLSDFPGALVLVTHDRYLLDRVSTEILALDGAGGANMYAEYAQWLAAQDEKPAPAGVVASATTKPTPSKPAPAVKRLTYMELRELEKMEQTIIAAEDELHARQKAVEAPEVIADHVKMRDAYTKLHEAETNVAKLYERWEDLSARAR